MLISRSLGALMGVLSQVRCLKGIVFKDSAEIPKDNQQEGQPSTLGEADLILSKRDDAGTWHKLLLDIDLPAWLIESSTPGHSHLIIDVDIENETWRKLMIALAEAGVIEEGYMQTSLLRGYASLRPPWRTKNDELNKPLGWPGIPLKPIGTTPKRQDSGNGTPF
jgi:hypothetical protein